MNICEKYYWIMQHPKFVPFGEDAIIEITPHMVCPETNHVEKLEALNTKLQFWVELMIPYFDEQLNQHCHSHDWEMDCGGDTWEEAVQKLYELVLQKYGDYTEEDMDKHREDALAGFHLKSAIRLDMIDPECYQTIDDIPRVMYEDYELDYIQSEISHYEELIKALNSRMSGAISMEQYFDYELELLSVQHDLEVLQMNYKHGFDVEKYGLPE